MNEYGYIKFHIEDILKEKGISKNTMCFDLRLQRTQLNKCSVLTLKHYAIYASI